MLILDKIIEKGTYRWIGQNYTGLPPQSTIIAGTSIENISKQCGFTAYSLGKYDTKNVFVLGNKDNIFYIYANPKFADYRQAFQRMIGVVPPGCHIDHVLSKNLALHFKYNYVLLCMVSYKVNIRHGKFEKQKLTVATGFTAPAVCFPDDRIYDKILSRNPNARRAVSDIKIYSPSLKPQYGLTLKQAGIWNSAFGFDRIEVAKLLVELSLII